MDKRRHSEPKIRVPVQKRSRRTRKKIINAARELFADLGFEDTTTNLIAERAGISIGSVYAHFTNKWEIFREILEDFSADVFSYLKKSVDQLLKREQGLDDLIEWVIPGLYQAHMLNGRLNFEIFKFTLKDEEAGAIRARWEEKTENEIIRLLNAYREKSRIRDFRSAAIVMHRSTIQVFQHLYKNRDAVDENLVLAEFIEMLKRYAVKA